MKIKETFQLKLFFVFRVMINYPWDDSPDAEEGEECVCPDDDVFKHLAALYADNHPFMWTG